MGWGIASDRSPNHPTSSSKPTQTTIEIAARHRLKPYPQGLASTCGLMCIINALHLAMVDVAPLTERDCKRLFAAGVEYLQRKQGFDSVAVGGMEISRSIALARHLVKLVSTTNCQVVAERPDHSSWSTVDNAFAWIDAGLAAGSPCLLAISGRLNHSTVVAGSTPTRLELHDSTGMSFIRKSSCGLDTGCHRIPFKGLLRIAVARPG